MSNKILYQNGMMCPKCNKFINITVDNEGIIIDGGEFLSTTGAVARCARCEEVNILPMELHNQMVLHNAGCIGEDGRVSTKEVAKAIIRFSEETGREAGVSTVMSCHNCSNKIIKRVVIGVELLSGANMDDNDRIICAKCGVKVLVD